MIEPDYKAAYAALARRIAAADAYLDAQMPAYAGDEIKAALVVINNVERPFLIVNADRPT